MAPWVKFPFAGDWPGSTISVGCNWLFCRRLLFLEPPGVQPDAHTPREFAGDVHDSVLGDVIREFDPSTCNGGGATRRGRNIKQ